MNASSELTSGGESRRRNTPLFIQIVGAVLWSFFGIRKRVNMRADFDRLPILAVIAGGVIAAALFVGGLLAVVWLIISQIAPS